MRVPGGHSQWRDLARTNGRCMSAGCPTCTSCPGYRSRGDRHRGLDRRYGLTSRVGQCCDDTEHESSPAGHAPRTGRIRRGTSREPRSLTQDTTWSATRCGAGRPCHGTSSFKPLRRRPTSARRARNSGHLVAIQDSHSTNLTTSPFDYAPFAGRYLTAFGQTQSPSEEGLFRAQSVACPRGLEPPTFRSAT